MTKYLPFAGIVLAVTLLLWTGWRWVETDTEHFALSFAQATAHTPRAAQMNRLYALCGSTERVEDNTPMRDEQFDRLIACLETKEKP